MKLANSILTALPMFFAMLSWCLWLNLTSREGSDSYRLALEFGKGAGAGLFPKCESTSFGREQSCTAATERGPIKFLCTTEGCQLQCGGGK